MLSAPISAAIKFCTNPDIGLQEPQAAGIQQDRITASLDLDGMAQRIVEMAVDEEGDSLAAFQPVDTGPAEPIAFVQIGLPVSLPRSALVVAAQVLLLDFFALPRRLSSDLRFSPVSAP